MSADVTVTAECADCDWQTVVTVVDMDGVARAKGEVEAAFWVHRERCRKRLPPADRAVCPLCWDGACEEQPPTVCRAPWCVCECNVV